MQLWNRLLRWYDKNGRDLPWRRTRDPYRILVSEIMLQQTQVLRVLVFYKRWLAQFPNWNALAAASNADVIRAWAGLGYNRRALMLRDIARQVAATTNHQPPTTYPDWLALKGVGPYTASAISAFALRHRTIPIDTNIRRVLGRLLFGIPYPQPTVDDRIRRDIDRILPKRGRFYDVPQALFDLATIHCTKVPTCATCPMRSVCPAAAKFQSGRVRVPRQMVRRALETKHRDKKFPDRIYRGRILKLMRENESVTIAQVGAAIDPTYDKLLDLAWVEAMLSRLETDKMLYRVGNAIALKK